MNFLKYLKISLFNIFPDFGQLLKWQDIESNVIGSFCYLILSTSPLWNRGFSDTMDKKNWCHFEPLRYITFLA